MINWPPLADPMSLRAHSPKNVSLHVMEDMFFRVSVNRQEHFLHVIRSEHGFESADEAKQIHKHLVAAVEPYVRFRVLVDLRKAKGNTNLEIEQAIREVWFPMLVQFDPLAVIVATATGRLHVARMFREHGSKGKVSLIESEAMQHLGLDHPPT